MRCPYQPINQERCAKRGSIPLQRERPSPKPLKVCADHLPHYLSNGWRRP